MSYLRRRQLRPSRNTVRPTLIKAVFGLILPMINPILHTARAEPGADMGDPEGGAQRMVRQEDVLPKGTKMKITPVAAPESALRLITQLDMTFTNKPKTYYVRFDQNDLGKGIDAINLMNGGAAFTALETQGVVPPKVKGKREYTQQFTDAVKKLQDKLIELKLLKKSDLEFPVQSGENTTSLERQGIDLKTYFYGKLNQATVDAWYTWLDTVNTEIKAAATQVQGVDREKVMEGLETYAKYGMMTTVVAVASTLVEKSDDIKLLETLSTFCAEQLYVCRDKGYKKQERELTQLFDRITKKRGEIAQRKVEAARRIEEERPGLLGMEMDKVIDPMLAGSKADATKALEQAEAFDKAIVALSKKEDRGKSLLVLDAEYQKIHDELVKARTEEFDKKKYGDAKLKAEAQLATLKTWLKGKLDAEFAECERVKSEAGTAEVDKYVKAGKMDANKKFLERAEKLKKRFESDLGKPESVLKAANTWFEQSVVAARKYVRIVEADIVTAKGKKGDEAAATLTKDAAFARVGAIAVLQGAGEKLDEQERIFTQDVSAPNYAIIFSSAKERDSSDVVKLLAQKRAKLGELQTQLQAATKPDEITRIGGEAKAILDAETKIQAGSVAMAIQEERRKTAVGTTEAHRTALTAVRGIRLDANKTKKENLEFQLEQVQNDRDVVNSTKDVKRNQSQKRIEYARIKREAEAIVAEEAKVPPPPPPVVEPEPLVTPAPEEGTTEVVQQSIRLIAGNYNKYDGTIPCHCQPEQPQNAEGYYLYVFVLHNGNWYLLNPNESERDDGKWYVGIVNFATREIKGITYDSDGRAQQGNTIAKIDPYGSIEGLDKPDAKSTRDKVCFKSDKPEFKITPEGNPIKLQLRSNGFVIPK